MSLRLWSLLSCLSVSHISHRRVHLCQLVRRCRTLDLAPSKAVTYHSVHSALDIGKRRKWAKLCLDPFASDSMMLVPDSQNTSFCSNLKRVLPAHCSRAKAAEAAPWNEASKSIKKDQKKTSEVLSASWPGKKHTKPNPRERFVAGSILPCANMSATLRLPHFFKQWQNTAILLCKALFRHWRQFCQPDITTASETVPNASKNDETSTVSSSQPTKLPQLQFTNISNQLANSMGLEMFSQLCSCCVLWQSSNKELVCSRPGRMRLSTSRQN